MRKLFVLCTVVASLVLGPVAVGAQANSTATPTPTPTSRPFVEFVVGHVVPGTSDISGVALSTATGFGPISVLATGIPFQTGIIIVFTIHATVTAPNGDQLVADGAITEVESHNRECQGSLIGGAAVFVPGTGRFANATGSVQINACVHRDVNPPRVNAMAVGTIVL